MTIRFESMRKNDDEFDLRVLKAVSGSQNVLGTDDGAATQGCFCAFLPQDKSLHYPIKLS